MASILYLLHLKIKYHNQCVIFILHCAHTHTHVYITHECTPSVSCWTDTHTQNSLSLTRSLSLYLCAMCAYMQLQIHPFVMVNAVLLSVSVSRSTCDKIFRWTKDILSISLLILSLPKFKFASWSWATSEFILCDSDFLVFDLVEHKWKWEFSCCIVHSVSGYNKLNLLNKNKKRNSAVKCFCGFACLTWIKM